MSVVGFVLKTRILIIGQSCREDLFHLAWPKGLTGVQTTDPLQRVNHYF